MDFVDFFEGIVEGIVDCIDFVVEEIVDCFDCVVDGVSSCGPRCNCNSPSPYLDGLHVAPF